MAVIILNGILNGHIRDLSVAFASGNDNAMKEAMSNLLKFEDENELVKLFRCKNCNGDIFWETKDNICEVCEGKEK